MKRIDRLIVSIGVLILGFGAYVFLTPSHGEPVQVQVAETSYVPESNLSIAMISEQKKKVFGEDAFFMKKINMTEGALALQKD